MKYLLHRLSALLLAALLLLSSVPLVGAAGDQPDPSCTLGTFSGDMLVGGTQVQTELGLFYLGDDGYIYRDGDKTPVYSHSAARLNYSDGTLYFARLHEDGFDVVGYQLATGEETVYLQGFSGNLRQLYLIDGTRINFLCDNIVWELSLSDGSYRMIRFALDLWSFVPTGCGLIYATGTLFDYSLFAEDHLLAEHVESYYVDFQLAGGAIVYSLGGTEFQIDLSDAFRGVVRPASFKGAALVNTASSGTEAELTEDEILALEAIGAEHSHDDLEEVDSDPVNQPPAEEPPIDNTLPEDPGLDPADYPDDPAAPDPEEAPAEEPAPAADPEPAEDPAEPADEPVPVEPTPAGPADEPVPGEPADEPAPAAPAEDPVPAQPTEDLDSAGPAEENRPSAESTEPPADVPGAVKITVPDAILNVPAPSDIFETDALDGTVIRRSVNENQVNIVKRAHQMLEIQWTPRQNITSWGGWFTYQAGVTYTGLPYCQAVGGDYGGSYVPWYTSLTKFIGEINNATGRMYTSRCTYGRGGPAFGVDCSAFVSWALDLPYRCSTRNIVDGSYSEGFGTLISSNSYADIQVGDFLNSSSHVVLVTDVTYNAEGEITAVQISEATIWNTDGGKGLCRSTWFTGSSGLARLTSKYFGGGYQLYRRSESWKNRKTGVLEAAPPVTYTHECVVPLSGDECPVCGNNMLLKPGVDVSQWQGAIDWQAMSPYIDFAILRIGYHGTVSGTLNQDAQFLNNVRGCVANNIPYGVYFYSYAKTPEEAMQEAGFVLEILSGLETFPELPIFLDVEEPDVLALPNDQLTAIVQAFYETIENMGFRGGLYASESPWNLKFSGETCGAWASWVAKWADSEGNIPADGSLTLNAANGANIWQYGAKQMPGVSVLDSNGNVAPVDVDYWIGSVGDTEHRYQTTKTPATCTEEGSEGYRCVVCGQSVSRNTPALGHEYVGGFCFRCGLPETVFDQYTDIFPDKWYSEAVAYAIEHGLFAGISNTSFAPSMTMNRAMMVTVLWRLSGEPEVPEEQLFDDVLLGKWYSEPVTWAAHAGVTNGVSSSRFAPSNTITREQAATFLYRVAVMNGVDTDLSADLDSFPDADQVNGFARKALSWAVAAGIIKGVGTGEGDFLKPGAGATRAEIATILMRYIQFAESDG